MKESVFVFSDSFPCCVLCLSVCWFVCRIIKILLAYGDAIYGMERVWLDFGGDPNSCTGQGWNTRMFHQCEHLQKMSSASLKFRRGCALCVSISIFCYRFHCWCICYIWYQLLSALQPLGMVVVAFRKLNYRPFVQMSHGWKFHTSRCDVTDTQSCQGNNRLIIIIVTKAIDKVSHYSVSVIFFSIFCVNCTRLSQCSRDRLRLINRY